MNTSLSELEKLVDENGPIRCVRVSSAKAKGRAKIYCYWGQAIYEIRRAKAGYITLSCVTRASSDRRSFRLAENDAMTTARNRKYLYVESCRIGRIDESSANYILSELDNQKVSHVSCDTKN